MLAAVISCVVISVLSAQQSIEGVLRKFYTGRSGSAKRSPCRCKQNAAEDRFSSCRKQGATSKYFNIICSSNWHDRCYRGNARSGEQSCGYPVSGRYG